MKKLIGIMLAIATVFCSFGVHTIADETTKDVQSEQLQAVRDYWNAVDYGDWAGWVECFAPSIREGHMQIATDPKYAEEKIGITAVSSAEVLEISPLSNEYASYFYKELHQYYEQEDAVACYKVVLNLVADESSDYFETGKCERVMILVKEDGHWYAGASYPFPQEDSELKSVHGYGFANYIPEPATICVKKKDQRPEIMDFNEYIFLGVCNEIGNYGYKTQAIYANVIAVKMLGWWAVSIKYRIDDGCDVRFGDVALLTVNRASEANQKTIRSAVNAMDGIRICCIKNGKEKLFNCDINGQEPLIGYQSSGRFWQETSNYLAKNKGYNVLLMDGQLDVAMVSMLEQKFEKVRFTRVDSDVVDNLIVKEDKKSDVLEAGKQEALSVIFKSQLPQMEKTEFNVMAQALGENAAPVMITQSEYMRRMKEMANIQAGMSFYGEMPDMFNLVLNADHKLVKEILADEDKECAAAVAPIQKEMDDVNTRRNELKKKQEGKKDEDIPTTEKDEVNDLDKKWEDLKNRKNGLFADYAAQNKVVRQLIDLALLQNGMLKGEALNNFVKRSIDLIK